MENITQQEISAYISGLPQTVKKIILENTWERRAQEIVSKYSLSEEQSVVLINLIFFVIIGVENPNTLEESIKNELRVSELLAEQIRKDLEVRVFDYIIKTIQNQDKKVESSEKPKESDLPEIRPEITPVIEPEEKVRVRPIPVGFSDNTSKPAQKPQTPGPELVQRPVSVPRYTAVPMEEEGNVSFTQKSTVQTEVPKPITPAEPAKTPEPIPEPVKKYAVDPYREPLE